MPLLFFATKRINLETGKVKRKKLPFNLKYRGSIYANIAIDLIAEKGKQKTLIWFVVFTFTPEKKKNTNFYNYSEGKRFASMVLFRFLIFFL